MAFLRLAARGVPRASGHRFYAAASLRQEWEGASALKNREPALSAVQTSKLPNGVTVVTYEDNGPVTAVTAFVQAGSRFEGEATRGSAAFLRALAFQDTSNRTGLHIKRETEQLGIRTHAAVDREVLAYGVTALRDFSARAVENLVDAVAGPLLSPWEVKEARARVNLGGAAPDQQHLEDATFRAAFRRGLGNSTFVSAPTQAFVNSDALRQFHGNLFAGSGITVVGSGIAHDELVHLVRKELGALPAAAKPAATVAPYHGGEVLQEAAGAGTALVLAHAAPGYAANAAGAADAAVLCNLLGSQATFVKWGQSGAALPAMMGAVPGAAAYSFTSTYSDAGLFGVQVAAPGAHIVDAARRAADAMAKVLAGNFSDADLARAKSQVAATVLDADRAGRDRLLGTTGQTPEQIAAAIDAVSAASAKKTGAAIAASARSLAARGNLWHIPYADQL